MAAWPTLIEYSYSGFSQIYVVSNAVILLMQLLCIAALARRATLIAFTLFFDLMHVAIFLASGILFWNWIVLNLIIVAGLTRLSFNRPSKPLLVLGVALLITSPKIFTVEMLGWYDAREINLNRVVAILDDGRRVDLPANFFRNHSVTFAQNWVDVTSAPRIQVGAAGGTDFYEQYRLSYECGIELLPASEAADPVGLQYFPGYFKHAQTLLDAQGRLSFNLVPHHIWANPALFKEASSLDIRRIVAVEHFREVVCVESGATPAAMKTRVLSSFSRRYDVRLPDE